MIELFRDAERHGPVPEHWLPNIDYPAELKERERVALNTLFLEPICVTVGQRQDYVNGQHRTHAMMTKGVRRAVVQMARGWP